MLRYFTSFVRCLDLLPACDATPVVSEMEPTFAEPTVRNIERWNGLGTLARHTDTFLYEFVEVEEISADGTQASVRVCHSTEVDIYVPGSTDFNDPDSELVIFGFPESRVERYLLFDVDGAWQMVSERTAEEGLGAGNSVCSDAAAPLVQP